MIQKMRFVSAGDGAVTVRFGRDAVIVRRLLEGRTQLIEAALSESFGAPTRLIMQSEGEAPAQTRGAARNAIDRSLDMFDRDKIVFTD